MFVLVSEKTKETRKDSYFSKAGKYLTFFIQKQRDPMIYDYLKQL